MDATAIEAVNRMFFNGTTPRPATWKRLGIGVIVAFTIKGIVSTTLILAAVWSLVRG